MKKKIGVILMMLVFVIGITSCTKETKTSSTEKKEVAENEKVTENEKEAQSTNKSKEQKTAESASDTTPNETATLPTMKDITIYYVNENVDGFLTESTSVDEITPEKLVEKLIEKNVLSSDIKVLTCKESTTDGVKSLDVDFFGTFNTFMNNQGSSSEYYVMGSICNTFLEAYGAEKIKITVEKGLLETGHAEYPNYMIKFK